MRATISVVLGLALGCLEAGAQERIVVGDTPACACRLEVELLTTIQDMDGRAGLSSPRLVERAPGGSLLVVPAARQGALLEFDGTGAYRRLVGRPGQGPREFGAILAIRPAPGDSMLVMDGGNRRLAWLDERLNVARTARLPVVGGWFGAAGDGGLLVLSGIPRRPADRLFLLDADQGVERSFMRTPASEPDSVESLRRRMAVSRDGLVAVTHVIRYQVDVWRADGIHERTLVREPPWFQDDAQASDIDGLRPPRTVQETPRFDPDGRLWTVTYVADRRWREGLGPVRGLYGRTGTGITPGGRDHAYDSVVEVIDLDTGRLVASLRVDPHLTLISDDGHAMSYREDEQGHPFIDVWRLVVVDIPEGDEEADGWE